MASNLAAADAITKVGYGDIHDQLDNFLVALDLVEKGSKHITQMNTEVQFAARMARSNGVGARNEYGNLPTARAAKDARASIYLKYQYGRIEGTGQVFKQVSTNTQGFVDWMNREMTDIKESLKRDLSRQVYGDGTGTLAITATGASAVTSIIVDDAHWLEIGMTIDVLTAATLTNPIPTKANTGGTLEIVNVDYEANEVFLNASVTATAGSALVRADIDGVENNWKKEWEGFGSILAEDEPLHEIDPAEHPRWNPGFVETGVGTFSELDLTHMAQGVQRQGGTLTNLLTGYGVVNSYWNSLAGQRRYKGDEKLTGGATVPVFQSVFGDIPIVVDPLAPKGVVYGINKKELFLHQQDDWAWMDKDGSMWSRVPNKDAYEATIFQYSNIGTFRRNTHAKLSGITEL